MGEKFEPGNYYWVVLKGYGSRTITVNYLLLTAILQDTSGIHYMFGDPSYPDSTRASIDWLFDDIDEAFEHAKEIAKDFPKPQ